jgi:hypothetical protein
MIDSPVIFRECPSGGREVAMLGGIEIGAVMTVSGYKRHHAAWLFFLPPARVHQWNRARDLEDAKRQLEHQVDQWLECARLRPTERACA